MALSLSLLAPTVNLQAQTASQVAESTDSTVTLDTVTVQATQEAAYSAPANVVSGLKVDTPLLETPQAISVVTEQVIKDQNAQDLEDVLRNVAGVTVGGYYSEWDYYRIRGFDSAFNEFRDGLRGSGGLSPELYGLERVEVIKGPASTLYGQAPLGGFVNLVSKRPKKEFGGEIGFTGGSWDSYEGRFDVNIPLLAPTVSTTTPVSGKSGKGAKDVAPVTSESGMGIYARVVGLYSDSESYVDYMNYERFYIAPSLTFEFSEDTSLTILSEYKRDSGMFAMPLIATGTVRSNPHGAIPTSRYFGLPDSNDLVQENFRAGYELKHRFNDVVALRQNLAYSYMDQTWDDIFYTSSLAPDQRTLLMYPYNYWSTDHQIAVDTALDFTFNTGSIAHTLTVGFDYLYNDSSYGSRQIDYSDPASYLYLDIFRPNYNQSIPGYSSRDYGDIQDQLFGIYIQEHAKLTDKFSATFGLRYDNFKREDSFLGETTEDKQDAFTPKVGLTYEFIPGVAAYANYSRSFAPQWNSKGPGGKSVDPEEGENWEAGVKFQTLEGKLSGMVSVFQLTRENVATANLTTADPFDTIVSGEQRSRGVEFETAAELLPGLNFTFAYAYTDAEVTEDNVTPVGNRLIGVADHAVSAWLKYSVQDGPLKGFGIGVGGRYYSDQAGDLANSFNIPSYGLLDAALYYERESFSVQVNFNNLTDKRHFVGSYDDLYVLPGEPFNVSASVTWKF